MTDRLAPKYLAYALGLSYAAMVCLAVAVNLLPVFATTLRIAFDPAHPLSHEQIGRIEALTFAGLVLAILITGPLADRAGAKTFAVLGNLLVGVGLGVLGLASGYPVVLLAVFIMGFGAGMLDMVLSPIVAALQPHRRTSAMNWLHSFYCVGAVATILVAALSLHYAVGWRAISLGMIGFPVLVGMGFALLKIPPLVADGQRRTPLRQLGRHLYFRVALVAIFLGGATELGMAYWLPAYAETGLGYRKLTADMSFLAFSLAMAVGRMGAGMLDSRIRPIPLMLGCCVASVVLFLIACFAPWPGVALAACILAGLAGSCLWPSMLGVAADRFPHGGASMFAMLAAMGNFGGIFMPWVVGVVADLLPRWIGAPRGYNAMHWGLSTATLCPLAMIVLLFWMWRRPADGQIRRPGIGRLVCDDA